MFEEKYRLTWLANLDTFGNLPPSQRGENPERPLSLKPPSIRKTGIICTLGPATNTSEMITKLRVAGMNIVRLNFSHGTHEYHANIIAQVHKSLDENPKVGENRPLAIALDTKGPEIRLGDLLNPSGYDINPRDTLWLTTDPKRESGGDPYQAEGLYIDYPSLGECVRPGQIIFVDDGILTLEAQDIQQIRDDNTKGGTYWRAKCIAKNGHLLLGRKGVNLPDCQLNLPAVSLKDAEDLRFAVEHDVDIIFASFIRHPNDIHCVREALGPQGTHIQIIAKIESREGVRNFDDILKEADGIMVARGDLGIEIPAEKVFLAQKMMIAKCNMAGKSVICATQMLESMTGNPRPTRAEASDVANAVLDGADCVMLSAETARGKYPVEAVSMMSRICLEAESAIPHVPLYEELCAITSAISSSSSMSRSHLGSIGYQDICETVARAAVSASLQPFVSAIICLSTTGITARLLAKYRPQVSVIVVTRIPYVARQLHLYRGCFPFLYESSPSSASGNSSPVKREDPWHWQKDVDRRFYWAMDEAKKIGLLTSSSYVVLVQGSKMGHGHSNTLKIVPVP